MSITARLSHTQRGLWFLHRLHPESAAYHISTMARVVGEVSNADLRAAFQAMVDRHPALRTTFPLAGDESVQVIPERGEVAFEVVDAALWSDAELRAGLEEAAFRPFDLERGPVFRASLFERGSERTLVVAMHHIVSDFGALVNLLQEPREGTKSFAQFVDWQAEMLAGPEGERLEAFWRERLAGLPELDLPADRGVRPVGAPEQGGAEWREIGARTLAPLKALARSRGATLYVVLLAAFQTLLHRYTGQEDFAVGSPVAGRPAGFGRVVGYFTNPVVLRADLAGEPSFREMVDRTRQWVVEALDHQHFPLPLLVERLRARAELFRTLLVFHRAPADAEGLVSFTLGEGGGRLRLDGFELESIPLAPRAAQFDVTLAAGERRGALGLEIIYDAARFDATTIARWLQHLGNLLTGAAGNPDTPVSELPLLSPWERHQLLREVNDGSDAGLPWSTLHEGFERQAARTPAAVALIDGERVLFRSELDARASALAGDLRRRGAGPETVVAVKLPRTADLIVALLAALKSGAAYLPLDPTYPEERIRFMVEDAGAGMVIDGLTSLGSFSSLRSFQPTPRSLAYLIYTSGSTGRPKGVAIEHAAAVRLVAWAGRAFSPDELRGVLAATSVNFDLSIFEIFVPLSYGGTVILAGNALALPELPARDEVTLINTVPSAVAGLLEMGLLPASVRTVNLAGEPLRRSLADKVLAAGVKLWDLYGPSEDTTYSTGAVVAAGDPFEPLIGWPLAGSRGYVLDRALRPLPLGVPGELYLGGGGLARGYLGRPALTAERFVPSPFEVGARLYRTGDLVRRRFDGALDYLGRLDHQVKIRGFRIELGEVEAALLAVPGVREAVVMAREGSLVAYVAPAQPEEALREALRARLPAPFVPSFFVMLEALPRTPNGKVDRKALPAPAVFAEIPSEPPVGPVEEALAAIWAGVLGREGIGRSIGRSESFFELGGHSLLATRVMARVRDALGVDLPLTALFEAPTVAGLAARIAAAQASSERPLRPVPRDRPLPLSFAQQRLWFLDRLAPGTAAYNVPLGVRLAGDLSPDLLARAISEAARRHEAVRTTFETHGGDPVQIVHPPAPIPVPLVDLQGLPEPARRSEALRLAQEEELRPFDLERGPVLRAGLLRLAPEEHSLLLTLHHIVCDEWSIRLLFREVVALYAAWSDGQQAVLPPLPVQYADFAVWQREQLTGPVLASQLAFWKSRLADPPVLELPTDRPRPPLQSFRGTRLPFVLPAETAAALLAAGRQRGATPFMTLLSAFQALLARTAGQTDLTVGTPITGRTRVEVHDLIGFFLNTLVLRADLSGDPGFAEIVDRARARALEAFAHQDLPFEKLVDEAGVERSLGHSPLFQALFVLLHATSLSGGATGLRVEPFAAGGATAKLDLTLSIEAEGESLSGVIEYNTDLFDRTTALRLAERFRVLSAAAAHEPQRPLSDLPVLPEAEAHQVLCEWNDRPPCHDVEVRLHDLIAARAEREPDRIAVEWEGGAWSYAGLVGQARALAGRLRDLGVGPDVPVGVYAGRGPELAVALLAVFAAGGVYLPIDPAYPRERQVFMLEDSGAPVLLVPEALAAEVPETAARIIFPDPSSPSPGGWVCDGRGGQGVRSAYVIYTSGSTGKPKGVGVPHRVLTNLILWQIDPDRPGGMPGAWRTLQLASPSFDVSLQEMLSTWCAGGTLVLVSDEDRRDPARLARRLAEAGIERLFLPYVALQQLAERLARPETPVPASLRLVVTAGEQLQVTPQLAAAFRRLSAATGGTALHNQYGPSETHVVTELVLDGDPGRWPATPSIGRPVAGAAAYVLDRALQPAPIGVPGELALGGVSPARGYLGRPDQTAGRFIPDAWSGVPGARLYRSGDLVRLLPDGNLEFLGRIDQQVKIRGYRIEPGEIEAALTAYPGVAEAVVLAPADARGERRLVAFVVPAPGEAPTPSALRETLRARLPDFMVPSAVSFVDTLPLTPSGKMDRRALSRASAAPIPAEPAGEAPRTPVEQVVAAIWGELLAAGHVGRGDSFFALGGHSLLAVRVCTRLRDVFGIEMPVRDLFEEPTVAGLSARVEAVLGAEGGDARPPLVALAPEERAAAVPVSLAQRRLWFFERLEPGRALYHLPA